MKKYLLAFFVFCIFSFPNETYSQGTTCATATPITLNGACLSGTIADATANNPVPTCGANTHEGWYTFTLAALTNITITAQNGNRNLAIQLISGPCATPTQISCTNAQGAGAGTETVSTSLAAGTYYIKILNVGGGASLNLTSLCLTTTAGGADPCTGISNIAACGTSVTANLTGIGAGWNINACGFSTPGDEQIYSFTPATTGTYSLNVSANTGGYVDYFWVNSTAGCGSGAGWSCIDDIFSTGTYGSMSWTAGQTYYILLDPEGTGSFSSTFSVNCVSAAANPCSSITNIANCGTSVTANLSGSGGGWNIGACGFTTPGDEMIYSYTAPSSGTYSINVTSANGGFVDFFYVNSTSGCSSGAGWNCIDDIFSAGNYGAMAFTAGQTYYILLDPEGTGNYSYTFSINCATVGTGPCASVTNIVGCGASYSASLTGTGAWNNMPCGFSTTGTEIIYSYTATTSGNHSINITAITGGFIDFAYVNAAGGCSSAAAWTCIDDVVSVGSTPTFNFTAGQTYYILLDPEGTGTFTTTFNLDCPGTVVTASDCGSAVNICSNASFQIDPNGYGSTMEIPPLGTIGNPLSNNPGGSGNSGCLQAFTPELNSTWMIINIATSGNLEFSFGAGGAQAGFYDWIMYPYTATTCAQIPTGTYAPARCNWNGSSTGGTGIAATPPAGGNPTNYEVPLPVLTGEQYVICFSNYSSAVTSVPLNFFGTATVSCTPLPSELMNFNGVMLNKEVLLDWKTLTETNTSHFLIQHSLNGIDFSPIGSVDAQGNANIETPYTFIHREPNHGINYYQLISVDLNSDIQTSRIIQVEMTAAGFEITEIYPNPTNESLSVLIHSEDEMEIEIEVTDVIGKQIHFSRQNITSGENSIRIPSQQFAEGMYHLRITSVKNNHRVVKQIFKQD